MKETLDLSLTPREANEIYRTLADIIICFMANEDLSAESKMQAHQVWITSTALIDQNTVKE